MNQTSWPIAITWLTHNGSQPPLLLSGNSDAAIDETVEKLALASACEKSHTEPCGICHGCLQIKHRTHAEIIFYATERASIPIEDMRKLLTKLNQTAVSFRRLVALQDAHKLTIPAANTLLKTLEEPSATTRFVLTTRWPRRLLPTILSRCQHVRLAGEAPAADASAPAVSGKLFERLAMFNDKTPLTAETLAAMGETLSQKLRQQGPNPELRRAFMRLRDYYVTTAAKGNERLARDVLLATWPNE